MRRPYRAPETLFSPHTYDARAVDMWCAGTTIAELFTALRLCPSLEDVDNAPADQSNISHPYVIPAGTHSITPGEQWQRDTLFDDRNGTLGLAWSIFQTMGSPTELNWPVRCSEEFSAFSEYQRVSFCRDLFLELLNPPRCIQTRLCRCFACRSADSLAEPPAITSPFNHLSIIYDFYRSL